MKKIRAEKITQQLGAPYYLILGSDPYLKHYALTELRNAFKQAEYVEQLYFTINGQTDWSTIYESCHAMNLFSNKTLLCLEIGEGIPNVSVATKLNTLCEMLTPDIGLIITLIKITKTQENSAWYKALSDNLVVVNCLTPEAVQLPLWIKNYLQQIQMTIELSAIELLSYYYEGNLLALTQIIEQIKLLYPNQTITYEQVESNINDSAIFTPFHLIDAMISNKSKRTIHILHQLKMNDFEPLILMRMIQRELILLINLKLALAEKSPREAFDEYRVWQNRRTMYSAYLNRFDIKKLFALLATLTEIEISLKHNNDLPAWDAMLILTMQFMGIDKC